MLPPPEVIDHVTAGLLVPVTLALNVCVAPSCTEALAGETFTTTGTAVTLTLTELPVIVPAPGCCTATCSVPVAAAVPAATSLVAE